jgi:hypothetical protein
MRDLKEGKVIFRVTPEKKARLSIRAREMDYPNTSKLLRALVDRVLSKGEAGLKTMGLMSPLDRKAVQSAATQLRVVGSLLNQLVKKVNIAAKEPGAPLPTHQELQLTLVQVRTAAEAAERALAQAPKD